MKKLSHRSSAAFSRRPSPGGRASQARHSAAASRQMLPASRRELPPGPLLAPLPVSMVSVGQLEGPANILTIAWNGVVNSDPPMLSISVQPKRYSHSMLAESGEFVVNLVDPPLAKAVDYCGVHSGRDVDKWAELDLQREAISGVAAPAIAQAPISLACKVRQTLHLGSHDLFLGEIVGVRVRADLLDSKGALHPERANLLSYIHGDYYGIGSWEGFFGWSIARPEVYRKRRSSALRNLKRAHQLQYAESHPAGTQQRDAL